MKSIPKTCIYCGGKATTRDHVIPVSYFPRPAPDNLITVPTCKKCNKSKQHDEDYLRTVLTSAGAFKESDGVADKVWPKVSRYLNTNTKILEAIYSSFKEVDIYYGPLYLGKRPAFSFDRDRVVRVISSIVKGLFYHQNKVVLQEGYIVKVLLNPKAENIPPDILEAINASEIKQLGEGVIRYRSVYAEENKNYSCWVLSFYNNDEVTFVCLTGKSLINV